MRHPFIAMADPFTIRIFVPDGEPEGVRLIDRMNWTGLGLVFPRGKWLETRSRPEFARTGVYILVGYKDEADDLPTLYIGQADGVKNRIDSHFQAKDFWDWAAVFVSGNNGLNRAHVTWLEHALVKRAQEANRSRLDNGNAPQEPALSESETRNCTGRAGHSQSQVMAGPGGDAPSPSGTSTDLLDSLAVKVI